MPLSVFSCFCYTQIYKEREKKMEIILAILLVLLLGTIATFVPILIESGLDKTVEILNGSKDNKELNNKIQNILNESVDRESIVNKLKKLLLNNGYKITKEEQYHIQFKSTSIVGGNIFNINLEPYIKKPKKEPPYTPHAYKTLECKITDNNETIKQQYRLLVKKYHPDFIQSKELDASFMEFAKQKLQEINHAYDTIKKERGI